MAMNITKKSEAEKKMDKVEGVIKDSGLLVENITVNGSETIGVACASSEADKKVMETVLTEIMDIADNPYQAMAMMSEIAAKQDELKKKAEEKAKKAKTEAEKNEALISTLKSLLGLTVDISVDENGEVIEEDAYDEYDEEDYIEE